jgi:Putative polyhydroxyalkanoic acid system protein (PHA_gran_rgn)
MVAAHEGSKRYAASELGPRMFPHCAGARDFAKKPRMKHQIQHDLDVNVAKEVASRAFEAYRARFADYHPRLEWVGERDARIEFSVKGLKLHGSLGIQPRAIELDLDVPFVFRLFKSKAIEVIEREVRAWIAKAKAGQLSPPAG